MGVDVIHLSPYMYFHNNHDAENVFLLLWYDGVQRGRSEILFIVSRYFTFSSLDSAPLSERVARRATKRRTIIWADTALR
jgi:hypothetical protein